MLKLELIVKMNMAGTKNSMSDNLKRFSKLLSFFMDINCISKEKKLQIETI